MESCIAAEHPERAKWVCRAVVVAVRGTSSVEDVITDSVAEPERLPPEWLPKGGTEEGAGAMFAHSGIKAAAESILDVRWPWLGFAASGLGFECARGSSKSHVWFVACIR